MVDANIAGILDDVVHQFREPLVFLRELIQNSIDAGTREIEVCVERDDDEFESDALALVTVEDWGSGMTREIIDRQLCRLFSSSKYGDYTKIGRFGIGFVSVYAVQPEWVAVDTGRGGENWRVIFLPDHSFEVYRLREPIEGTRVTLAKRVRPEAYDGFVAGCREVVSRWCKHVPLPVYFDGEDVREPFEVESTLAAEHREDGTRLVAGLVREMNPRSSFYNRGLLLKETSDARWPHLQFKVDSRYLEHTLTRDDVVHDTGYERIEVILDELATEKLPGRLLFELVEAAKRADLETLHRLYPLIGSLAKHAPESVKGWQKQPIFAAVGRTPLTFRELEELRRHRRLALAHSNTELARRVALEHPVVLIREIDDLAIPFDTGAPFVEERYALVHREPPSSHSKLEDSLRTLLGERLERRRSRRHDDVDFEIARVRVEAEELVPLLGAMPDGLILLDHLVLPDIDSKGFALVVNHPLTAACLARSNDDPDLAARALLSGAFPRLAPRICREGIEAMA